MAQLNANVGIKFEVKDFIFPLEELTIESGAFDDVGYYGNLSSVYDVYVINAYGASLANGGGIPARNPLPILGDFIRNRIPEYANLWATQDVYTAGFQIGTDINNMHRLVIEKFAVPDNAQSTVARKGFNDPLVDKGVLVNSIYYSINGSGRYY